MSKFPENSQIKVSGDFSNRIRHLIYENECQSNKDLAELIGISTPVISKAVNYGIIPSLRSLIKIADKFDLSLKYLLGIDEQNEFIPTDTPTTFYDRFDMLAKEKKLKYAKIASQMSFERTYIYEWFKEGTLPSLEYLFQIADFFKVSPDYLLGRTDYKN